MRTLPRAVAPAILVPVIAGCSTYTVHAIPGLAARDAAASVEVDGVRIGAQPYGDFGPAREIFSRSPMEKGVLPVLLIVESPVEVETGIELTRARIELETPDGGRLEPLDRMSACREAAGAAPAAFLGVFPTTDLQAMAFDWGAKCVPDLWICRPGGTRRAFLFFPVGRPFAANGPEQCTLVVGYERADGSKRGSVRIPLKVGRRRLRPGPEAGRGFDFDIG